MHICGSLYVPEQFIWNITLCKKFKQFETVTALRKAVKWKCVDWDNNQGAPILISGWLH